MKLNIYFHTLRLIKPVQIWHQIYYRLRGKLVKFTQPKTIPQPSSAEMRSFIPSYVSFFGNGKFEFLNQVHVFDNIDWNFNKNGKLWTYNLNYFEFLNQPDFSKEEGLRLINDFIYKSQTNKDGYEPYPISLRIINWVKFLSRYDIQEDIIDRQLYSDCIRLTKSLEYHLLANHLLENGFGLLFGAYYFRDERLYRKAEKIIRKELKEQILSDGAHYELSPMYHQIILSRVLDSYNLVTSNSWENKTILKGKLHDTAQIMLSWLENMTFKSGEIPMVNDASPGIAPETKELVEYAAQLGITRKKVPLGVSGYRMFKKDWFELLCDVGQISPAYQPGHSHADNLNFILHVDGIPYIVDTGISTYEKNERRQYERSTQAHNTLVVNGENSSQVWGGFRVGKRAKTTILEDTELELLAQHNGYRHRGFMHRRIFKITDKSFYIADWTSEENTKNEVWGYIHFHPDITCEAFGDKWLINNKYELVISPNTITNIETYQFSDGFNKQRDAKRLAYKVNDRHTMISFFQFDYFPLREDPIFN